MPGQPDIGWDLSVNALLDPVALYHDSFKKWDQT